MDLKLILCLFLSVALISVIECRVKSHVRHGHLRKPLHYATGQDKVTDNFKQGQEFMQHQLNNEHKDRGWKHGRRTSSSEEDRSRSSSKSQSESWERHRYRFGDKVATERHRYGKDSAARGLKYAAKFKNYMKENGCDVNPVYGKFLSYFKAARKNLKMRNETEDVMEYFWLDEIAENLPEGRFCTKACGIEGVMEQDFAKSGQNGSGSGSNADASSGDGTVSKNGGGTDSAATAGNTTSGGTATSNGEGGKGNPDEGQLKGQEGITPVGGGAGNKTGDAANGQESLKDNVAPSDVVNPQTPANLDSNSTEGVAPGPQQTAAKAEKFQLFGKGSKRCLGHDPNNAIGRYEIFDCKPIPSQTFQFVKPVGLADPWFQIKVDGTGRCFGLMPDGNTAIPEPCENSPKHYFKINKSPTEPEYFELQNQGNKKCLAVKGNLVAEKSPIYFWQCGNGNSFCPTCNHFSWKKQILV